MEEPDDIETAWAGILNGAMISLLGSAFPAILLWTAATRWQAWTSSGMTTPEVLQGLALTGVSAQILWFGVRMTARHIVWLRKRQEHRNGTDGRL